MKENSTLASVAPDTFSLMCAPFRGWKCQPSFVSVLVTCLECLPSWHCLLLLGGPNGVANGGRHPPLQNDKSVLAQPQPHGLNFARFDPFSLGWICEAWRCPQEKVSSSPTKDCLCLTSVPIYTPLAAGGDKFPG